MKNLSLVSLVLSGVVLLSVHFFFYPKWQQTKTEATISWDVSGYYMYLPAIFIYGDIKECSFKDDILEKYHPTPDFQQAFKHESGHYVMKYPAGMALQYSPFFFIAHLWATGSSEYPVDGFSFPYQFMLSMGSLLIALIGLYFLRRILLWYFEDLLVGLAVLGVVIGTNYLNYSAIDGAMTHNYLFTLYTLLIFTTVRWYQNPTRGKAVAIGCLIGLMTLTRPTEIISVLIPLLWGVNIFSKHAVSTHIDFLKRKKGHILRAGLSTFLVLSIQVFYWKYASGDWIVYSYEDQGFSWFDPHIFRGLFSYRSGWLVYSPLMIFALIGFVSLYHRKKELFAGCLVFSLLFIYIAFAWDIWWYGGSLGQRSMIQAYPVLFLPFTALLKELKEMKYHYSLPVIGLMVISCYLNIWFTRQAHRNGMLRVGEMNGTYFWRILGTWEPVKEDVKYLDTDEDFRGARTKVQSVYRNEFELSDSVDCDFGSDLLDGAHLCLNKERQKSPEYSFRVPARYDWIRVNVDVKMGLKEYDKWKMTQCIVRFTEDDSTVKEKIIRIPRLFTNYQEGTIYFDVEIPEEAFDEIRIQFDHAGSDKQLAIDNLNVEAFNTIDICRY